MIDLNNWENFIPELSQKEVEIPHFDRASLRETGQRNPVWIHFGGGNLYRGFHAEIAQCLADQGELPTGVIVCETFDEKIIEKAYRVFDDLILEVVMPSSGKFIKRVLAATADSLYCHPDCSEHFAKMIGHFENPSLQLVTFAITEKGYRLKDTSNKYIGPIAVDIKNGPKKPSHTMSILAALLYRRFLSGAWPIALVSTDNFSQNGSQLRTSLLTIAKEWQKEGYVPETFIQYLSNEEIVAFPWTMIDRITPNPSISVSRMLAEEGFLNMSILQTAKGTNIAPFVNTEDIHYLIMEDHFPNGRPRFEKAGVFLTDRATVDKADTMKVTTCLNPLHTALAIMGCLLGYRSIAEEMKDPDLSLLVSEIGYNEGLPVVESPGIINPKTFLEEVVTVRFSNPNIPDMPQRIATDTSQKVAIRYGETIKKYMEIENKDPQTLVFIPLILAAWLRYLIGLDDQGKPFTPSPDPLLVELQHRLSDIQLGTQDTSHIQEKIVPILSNKEIFGVDLYQAEIGRKIEGMFIKMLAGPNAVRKTLQNYLQEHGGTL